MSWEPFLQFTNGNNPLTPESYDIIITHALQLYLDQFNRFPQCDNYLEHSQLRRYSTTMDIPSYLGEPQEELNAHMKALIRQATPGDRSPHNPIDSPLFRSFSTASRIPPSNEN